MYNDTGNGTLAQYLKYKFGIAVTEHESDIWQEGDNEEVDDEVEGEEEAY